MRKLIGILFITLTTICGGLFILTYLAFGSGTFYGHLGYCREVKLPGFHLISVSSMTICLLLILYYLYVESFTAFEKNRKIYTQLLPVCIAILGCLACYAFRFPFVNRSYGLISQSGKQDGLHNPVMASGTVYAVVLAWLNIRFRTRNCITKRALIASSFFIAAFLLATALVCFTVKYEVCFG